MAERSLCLAHEPQQPTDAEDAKHAEDRRIKVDLAERGEARHFVAMHGVGVLKSAPPRSG